jgi:hypothetical protein
MEPECQYSHPSVSLAFALSHLYENFGGNMMLACLSKHLEKRP